MKQQLNEIKRMQQLAGIIREFDMHQFSFGGSQTPSQEPKASFQGKFEDVKDVDEFIKKFHIKSDSPLTKIVSRYIGDNYNYAITDEDGKFNVYKFRQTANPGKPIKTFNSIEDAKRGVKELEK